MLYKKYNMFNNNTDSKTNYFLDVNVEYFTGTRNFLEKEDYAIGRDKFYDSFVEYAKNINLEYYDVEWETSYNKKVNVNNVWLSPKVTNQEKIKRIHFFSILIGLCCIISMFVGAATENYFILVSSTFISLITFFNSVERRDLKNHLLYSSYLKFEQVSHNETLNIDNIDEITNRIIKNIQNNVDSDEEDVKILKNFLWQNYNNCVDFTAKQYTGNNIAYDNIFWNRNSNNTKVKSIHNNNSSQSFMPQLNSKNYVKDLSTDEYEKIEELYNNSTVQLNNMDVLNKILELKNLIYLMNNDDKEKYQTIVRSVNNMSDLIVDSSIIDNTNIYKKLDNILLISNNELDIIVRNIESNNNIAAQLNMELIQQKISSITEE